MLFSGNTWKSFSSFGYLTCNHKDSDLYQMERTEPLQLTAKANKIEKENEGRKERKKKKLVLMLIFITFYIINYYYGR